MRISDASALRLARLILSGAVLFAASRAAAAGELRPVLHLPLGGLLTGTAADGTEIVPVKFSRGTPATFWDANAQRLGDAEPDAPRYERQPGKFWGSTTGLFVEAEVTNLFTHSSFEADQSLAAWKTRRELKVSRIDGGAHGKSGLRLEGRGRLFQTIKLPVETQQPWHNRFCVSFFVRREDGEPVSQYDIYPLAATSEAGQNGIPDIDIFREIKERGPWVRVAGKFGFNGRRLEQDVWTCGLEAASGAALIVDAIQLEQGRGQNYGGGATSFIPTQDQPARRASDSLAYDLKPFINRPQGTIAFWTWNPETPSPCGKYMIAHGNSPYGQFDFQGVTWGGSRVAFQQQYFPKPLQWTFLAFTWRPGGKGGVAEAFLNGRGNVNLREGPVPFEPNPPPIDDPVWIIYRSHEHIGLISDLMVFDTALTAGQVKQLYKFGK